MTAKQLERAAELNAAWDADEHTETMAAEQQLSVIMATLFGQLSAPQLWQNPSQTVRGLALRTSPLYFLLAWYQALLLKHPDAPPISNARLAWLCDGTLGNRDSAPFVALWDELSVTPVTNDIGEHPRLEQFRKDAAQGRYVPDGQWEEPIGDEWRLLHALGVQTLRVVATADGCWVRLIDSGWGGVLWWKPEQEPPLCWSLAFAQPRRSSSLLALHEIFWTLWYRLRVNGGLHEAE